jgi:hypothetical protein
MAHRRLNQLFVILGVKMGTVRNCALDSPHGLAAPFCDYRTDI